MRETSYFEKLVELMGILRGPEGCPWDREQTRETLKPLLIEEAYEVLEALDQGDPGALCEELGDLLFQVVFHSKIAEENGEFDAERVCRRVYEKMVRRHPHVFGDLEISTSEELLRNWEDLKAAEKAANGEKPRGKKSMMEGIPDRLPAPYVAYQITAKAARVGFDWPDLEGLRAKFLEEFDELEQAIQMSDEVSIKEEVGDLLFVAMNVARRLEVDPETALNRANRKFVERFSAMEEEFARRGQVLKDVSLDEMEAVWQALKQKDFEPDGRKRELGMDQVIAESKL